MQKNSGAPSLIFCVYLLKGDFWNWLVFEKSRAGTGQVECWLPLPSKQEYIIPKNHDSLWEYSTQSSIGFQYYNRESGTWISINMTLSAIEVLYRIIELKVIKIWLHCLPSSSFFSFFFFFDASLSLDIYMN